MALTDETDADQGGAGARLLWKLRPATPGFPLRCEIVMNSEGILLRARIGEEVLYAERFASTDVEAAERVAGEMRTRLMDAGWLTERRQDSDWNRVAASRLDRLDCSQMSQFSIGQDGCPAERGQKTL